MKEYNVKVFDPRINKLGEGIFWDSMKNKLVWVDIFDGLVFECDLRTNTTKTYETNDFASTAALWGDNKLIVSGQRNLYLFDRETGEKSTFLTLPNIPDTYRLNDGKTDDFGRFYVGSMNISGDEADGKLYRVLPDGQVKIMARGIGVSNGLCWSEDNETMYYIDSPTRQITVFDFDVMNGDIFEPRCFIDVAFSDGVPDGMTIDNNGMLWVAFYGGSAVYRINPDNAEILAVVHVPVEKATSCTFVGNTLYITSAGGGVYYTEIQ